MHGYLNVFAIRFYPYGLYSFINVSSSLLTDSINTLDTIFGKDDSDYLNYAVRNASGIMDKIVILENFLYKKINPINKIELTFKECYR